MQIGCLRAGLRRTSAEPEYYRDYTPIKAFGKYLRAQICPFDGKAFLHRDWRWQHGIAWYGRSVNGLIPAALIGYELRWRKKTKANKKYSCFFTRFPMPYDDIIVNYTYSLEGVWIELGGKRNTPHITVLKTTRLKVKFKAEKREVLLPPGATIYLSPLPLMQKLGKNISVGKRERPLPPEVIEVFTSAKTPLELAARLELEPIKLQEELGD